MHRRVLFASVLTGMCVEVKNHTLRLSFKVPQTRPGTKCCVDLGEVSAIEYFPHPGLPNV